MLKIDANIRNFKIKLVPLSVYGDYLLKSPDGVIVPSSDMYNISNPDIIVFKREDGERIDFEESKVVQKTEKNSDFYRYFLGQFPDFHLKVSGCEIIDKNLLPNTTVRSYLLLTLKEEHQYIANRDDVQVKTYVDCSFQEGVEESESEYEPCVGDYAVYSDYFLYRLAGSMDLETAEFKNYRTTIFYDDAEGTHAFEAIIPINLGGLDDTWHILLYGNEYELAKIASNPFLYDLYGHDERFFVEGAAYTEDGIDYTNLSLKPGVTVNFRSGDMRISLPFGNDFATDAFQDEEISQFVNAKSDGAINSIIDYEKQQFVPVYGEHDVSKLIFRIHLREREDYDEWNTNDNLGWIGGTELTSESAADSVTAMGFDEDDIYYQKKKVSETFLRVSLYDSPDRRTQKLLYTAKVFLNSSELYGQYIRNIEDNEETMDNIGTEFICTHKYDYDNSTEGFYLHLFPSNLEAGESGITYMKFELNNAKYGKSVPLVLFKRGFREGYMVETVDDSGNTLYSVDMGKLYNDLYTAVSIRKNDDRYEWEIPCGEFVGFGNDGDNVLTLQLVEPRINAQYGDEDYAYDGCGGEAPRRARRYEYHSDPVTDDEGNTVVEEVIVEEDESGNTTTTTVVVITDSSGNTTVTSAVTEETTTTPEQVKHDYDLRSGDMIVFRDGTYAFSGGTSGETNLFEPSQLSGATGVKTTSNTYAFNNEGYAVIPASDFEVGNDYKFYPDKGDGKFTSNPSVVTVYDSDIVISFKQSAITFDTSDINSFVNQLPYGYMLDDYIDTNVEPNDKKLRFHIGSYKAGSSVYEGDAVTIMMPGSGEFKWEFYSSTWVAGAHDVIYVSYGTKVYDAMEVNIIESNPDVVYIRRAEKVAYRLVAGKSYNVDDFIRFLPADSNFEYFDLSEFMLKSNNSSILKIVKTGRTPSSWGELYNSYYSITALSSGRVKLYYTWKSDTSGNGGGGDLDITVRNP